MGIINKKSAFFIKHKVFFHLGFYLLLIVFAIFLYRITNYTYITVQFEELRPFRNKLSVYYKGYKIGRTGKIRPSDNYKASLVDVVLYPKNLKLPKNITAKLKMDVKQGKKEDFIEIIYPSSPSVFYLRTDDVIKGIATIDIESYLASQEPASLDAIKNDAANTVKSLQKSVEELGKLFVILQEVVQENRGNLRRASSDLAKTSENIKQMTHKVNISLRQEALNNIVSNVDSSAADFKQTSENLQIITKDIDTLTKNLNTVMPSVNSSLTEVDAIAKNLNEITCGISQTLKKKMGGLRLIFGQTIDVECSKDK